MSRYIDADALKARLEDFSKWCKDGRKQGVDFVLDCPLPDMPTADVVPRETIEQIFAEIDKIIYRYMNDGYYSGGDVVYALHELKKKYIGEQKKNK